MSAFPLFMASLLMLGAGIYQLAMPLDHLRQVQERRLLARGLEPRVNETWGNQARRTGWMLVVSGLLFLVSGLAWMFSVPKAAPQMSPTIINGRRLTQEEWDACGRDTLRCVEAESYTKH